MSARGAGIVYLVGAGPGDPDLITVRGLEVLEACDAVVFDNLIPDELLVRLPGHVARHYVGKRSGHHSLPQQQINELLVTLASEGRRVVRLKGGDPFVFGRGAEEATFLREHGIAFEVVPGVTSGVAALSYAGIPCTDRSESSYVMFLTGHQAVEKAVSTVPWDWVAGARKGTLVIYMGVAEIRRIVDKLTEAGMPADTPCAVVERGTCPTQRVRTSVLEKLPVLVVRERIRPPALFVVGGVARYHRTLDWFGMRPLSGLRVIVTRPADQSRALYRDLRRAGAEVLAYPTIATAANPRIEEWDVVARNDHSEGWLVFTCESGVRYFVDQWCATLGDLRALSGYRVLAVGHSAVEALKQRQIRPDFVLSTWTPDDSVQGFGEKRFPTGTRMILVTGDGDDAGVERALRSAGAEVATLQVYLTYPVPWPTAMRAKLSMYPPDLILCTSRAEVDGLSYNLGDEETHKACERAAVVSIDSRTSAAIRSRGLRVAFESRAGSVQAIVDELVAHHPSRNETEGISIVDNSGLSEETRDRIFAEGCVPNLTPAPNGQPNSSGPGARITTGATATQGAGFGVEEVQHVMRREGKASEVRRRRAGKRCQW
jgi:uroporphyrinogen III methyltransferase/synthase